MWIHQKVKLIHNNQSHMPVVNTAHSEVCYHGVPLWHVVIFAPSDNQCWFNTLRLRQNGRHFAHDIFKCIFLNGNAWISLKISLKFVPKVRINNIPALVQIMAWRRPGDKPLSEPMMVSLLTHICVTRTQWVKVSWWRHDMETLDLISGPFWQWSTNHCWISLAKV